jgi:hypothetical protein
MLPRLLLREWILVRRALLAFVGIYLAFQAYFACRASSPRQYLVFASIYAAFLTLPLFLREEKFRATAWSCSMPVSRQDLVRARYLGAWIFVAVVLALALILAGVMPGSRVHVPAVLDPSTLLQTLAVVTVILALMFPFTIRFGALGVMIFLVGIQMLGAVVLLIAVKTGGGSGASKGLLSGGVAALGSGMAALRDLMGPAGFNAAAALCLLLANWLGYRLAVAMFRRREL